MAMESEARRREALACQMGGQQALDHAIAAAELYMKAVGSAKTAADKVRLKQKFNDLVALAERLKKTARAKDSVSEVESRLKLPRLTRQIPTAEKNILLRASRLHANIFPPWVSDPDPDEFTGPAFFDPAHFPLSALQTAVFGGWKRPSEIVGTVRSGHGQHASSTMDMHAHDDYDLVQDVTTDCSVVASLCASVHQLRPGPNSILPALMFPVDSETGQPQVSENGRYVFRMYFNGCFRKVVIDDRLPSSSTDRTLYVVDRQDPHLIWPALMEKAYLKVRGGYDFPGSNSGTDLWVLTGWIPQQLFLQSDDIDFNQTWARMKKAYDYSDVVVTLGTGRLSEDEERTLGLAGEHDYAVLDISESSDRRMMLVKNPWCDGLVWKGSSFARPEHDPTKLKPGAFWIDFDHVVHNFESLYLNWNPALFTQRQDHHFAWDLPAPSSAGSFAHNPQYSVCGQVDGSIWMLLSRHFQDQELDIAKSRSPTLAATSNQLGFMALYIFDNKGQRVELRDKSLYSSPFVDSPQTLATLDAEKGVKYTVVVAQQDLPLPKYSFTISFFSRSPLEVRRAAHSMAFYEERHGSWTRRTAGGNSSSATYLQNPQFAITLPAAGPLSILLSTEKEDVAVHVDVVWAGGQRVTAVTVRDLVASSGEYRRGCAQARIPSVDAGTYTVVCSTFEPDQLADFSLRVGSMQPCRVAPVAADAAGRLRTPLPLLHWCHGGDDATAAANKRRAALSAPRLTRASVLVRRPHHLHNHHHHHHNNHAAAASPHPGTPRSHPTVRVRLEHGRGPDKAVLASTGDGDFREVGLGLRTPDFDIDPHLVRTHGLWLAVEQTGSCQPDDGLAVEILSDGQVHVDLWETVDT